MNKSMNCQLISVMVCSCTAELMFHGIEFLYIITGPIFYLLLRVSSDYAQPITGQVTEVTCLVIGRAQPQLTLSKRQKTVTVYDCHLYVIQFFE